jgi:hypothetical protein
VVRRTLAELYHSQGVGAGSSESRSDPGTNFHFSWGTLPPTENLFNSIQHFLAHSRAFGIFFLSLRHWFSIPDPHFLVCYRVQSALCTKCPARSHVSCFSNQTNREGQNRLLLMYPSRCGFTQCPPKEICLIMMTSSSKTSAYYADSGAGFSVSAGTTHHSSNRGVRMFAWFL